MIPQNTTAHKQLYRSFDGILDAKEITVNYYNDLHGNSEEIQFSLSLFLFSIVRKVNNTVEILKSRLVSLWRVFQAAWFESVAGKQLKQAWIYNVVHLMLTPVTD